MKITLIATLLLLLSLSISADVNKTLLPLPCGIYDQAVKPLVEKDLETQNEDRARYTMGVTTKTGKVVTVEVKSVNIMLPGERNHVSVFLDGKPHAKTSHQDVPIYLEVHIDNEKYRIICVRLDEPPPAEVPDVKKKESLITASWAD